MKRSKEFIYNLIHAEEKKSKLAPYYDVVLVLCIIVSSGCALMQLFGIATEHASLIVLIEEIITGFFVLEYLLKFWVAECKYPQYGKWRAKWEFITSFESFIDIICILAIFLNNIPSELAALKLLKITKLVRLFKLTEIFDAKKHEGKADAFNKKVYEIICKDTHGDVISKIYDIFSITLIMLSVVILIVDTFALPTGVRTALHVTEYIIAAVFAVEYIVRIWTAPVEYPDCDPERAKMKYILSFMAMIDLLSILPVFLTQLDASLAIVKILKLFKILRLVKMSRYLTGINRFVSAVASKKKQIAFSMLTVIFLMVLCSVFIYAFEHVEQPDVFDNALSGITYSFVTLTGIGDTSVAPITSMGKTFSTIMTVLGVCVFAVPVTIITEEFMRSSKLAADAENRVLNTHSLPLDGLKDQDKKLLLTLYDALKNDDDD